MTGWQPAKTTRKERSGLFSKDSKNSLSLWAGIRLFGRKFWTFRVFHARNSCMATKTISLELDAYEKLKRAKQGGESFSSVVRRARFDVGGAAAG
jgi:hypothetical protein